MGTIILPRSHLETPSKGWRTSIPTDTDGITSNANGMSAQPKDERPKSARLEGDDPSDIPTIMIFLSLKQLPKLVDVSEDDPDESVHEFKRGTFRWNVRPRFNSQTNSAVNDGSMAGYRWHVAYKFFESVIHNSCLPTLEGVVLTGFSQGDSVRSILKRYIREEQKQASQDTLEWLEGERNKLSLTDDDFLFEIVYSQKDFESPRPPTKLPEENVPLDDETIDRQLDQYKGWRLAGSCEPTMSSKADEGASLWRIDIPSE
ncbi:hypothetical protein I302_101282 [Kwoniella bestiolae CBS 10118]|uniref:Uncharacterized protein n=1 Tax=Kwoniella bestiolae CBS 10118 TaxID=1296100 RepID=A0A1B9G7E8_9TREE|nr:hypothetical protein I302_04656 [Kwoniella bestiolae CBS 10118]OCF26964.1 hypothetical protein I302_04656 [Kwoniella bestiolae CBS 10118]